MTAKPRKLFSGKPRLSRMQFDRHVERLISSHGPRLKRSEAVALVVRHVRVVPARPLA
jgi:predicted component of type VI protein secretion system